jgi:cytochrome P450
MSTATGRKTSGIPFLDIVDSSFDPAGPAVFEAQARSWYAETPIGLLVLRHAEVHELLRDPRLDHNGKGYMEMNGIFDGPIYDWYVPLISNVNGPDHRRLRGLVSRAFSPRMVDGLRPFIRARAEDLTGQLAPEVPCEFVEDFANQLPLAVMCELLGVPAEDREIYLDWLLDLDLVFSLAHGGDIAERVAAAIVGLNGYVAGLMEAKRGAPPDTLIPALLTAQRAEGRVSEAELHNLLITLMAGALDTTRLQISNAMVVFAEHPGQWTLLGRYPELAGRATTEVMRWIPATPTNNRFAAEDIKYRGLHIAKGTLVTVCVAAAQRDPRVYEAGDTFDIAADRSAPLLQFGAGPHHCLGFALAHAELEETLPVLAGRLGPPRVDGPITWRPPLGMVGPNSLRLLFGHPDPVLISDKHKLRSPSLDHSA